MMAQTSWLENCSTTLSSSASSAEVCKALYTIMNQVKASEPALAADVLELLYHPKASKLLSLISRADKEDFVISAIQCIDETLNALCETELKATQVEALEAIGDTLLHLHYGVSKQLTPGKDHIFFLLGSLSLLSKIVARCPNYTQTHISELLGVAKANVRFGLETVDVTIPQKIMPSQNLPYDSSAEELDCESAEIEANVRRSGGGRIPKKRKPRSLAKSLQSNNQNQQQQQTPRFQILTLDQVVSDIRTSDSDASELDNTAADNRISRTYSVHDRQKHAKIRQLSINLMGTVVTRLQERRILYGYWHAFFENTKIPTNEPHKRRCDLLYIGLRDPNNRCRATALQVAAQLVFSSRNLLQQAECVIERLPTSFLPFAHSLGLQVVSMFEELTQILFIESSLQVIIQALKCLAVLVQATTPFRKFQPRNFVTSFVNEVQRLIGHRDETIQVAALMVMEFLIAAPDLTPEVLNSIGITHHIRSDLTEQSTHEVNGEDLLESTNSLDDVEHIESGSEDDASITAVSTQERRNNLSAAEIDANKAVASKPMTWLLQCVLHNLGACPNECNRHNILSSTNSVRIESLQVLAAMAQHFPLLESHLSHVAVAIQNGLLDPQPDLRYCAARCLDTIVYQIGRILLENTSKASSMLNPTERKYSHLEEECLSFWSSTLPTIIAIISSSSPDVTTPLKVCLCDVLSSMGVVVFEQQPYTSQMNLIGFLSGIACDSNEDSTIRCAAVRALAVYVLFPSLRGNFVFVENAAELTLKLIEDANILVRVKASWALGNISDALLLNNSQSIDSVQIPERISDDLFWRLISAAIEACNDNDKVRCNAVRTLGNLLRLLSPAHFKVQSSMSNTNRLTFQNAINKLIDCLRTNASAKVKWNTCYAIGNVLQNPTLFASEQTDNNFDWQSKLYSTLANVIVQHPNFKVRINAATALTRVATRAHFGIHYEALWKALLNAIEQSHHLDNFYEYNHRDFLQEQLCLAISHLLHCAQPQDFVPLQKHLMECEEILRNTWTRVINRMLPEKSAPIVSCSAFLQKVLNNSNVQLTTEQRNAITAIALTFETQ